MRVARSVARQLASETDSRYAIQIGRGRGTYRTRFSFPKIGRALVMYAQVHLDQNEKKRLVDIETGKIIDKEQNYATHS